MVLGKNGNGNRFLSWECVGMGGNGNRNKLSPSRTPPPHSLHCQVAARTVLIHRPYRAYVHVRDILELIHSKNFLKNVESRTIVAFY